MAISIEPKFCNSALAFINCRYADQTHVEKDEDTVCVPIDGALCTAPLDLYSTCPYRRTNEV